MSEQRKVRTDYNNITGKSIVTNHKVDISQDHWDSIFGKKEVKEAIEAADRGEFATEDEVKSIQTKWETSVESNNETPVQQAE